MNKKMLKKILSKIVSEDVLTEDVLTELVGVFDIAVKKKSNELIKNIKEEIMGELRKELQEFKELKIDAINQFFEEVTKEIIDDNKLVIEQHFENEKNSLIVSGFKDILEKYNFAIGENDVDIVEELKKENEELTEKYNNSVRKNMEFNKERKEEKALQILESVIFDMTDVDAENFIELVEDQNIEDLDDFKEKLILSKKYFLNEEIKDDDDDKKLLKEYSYINKNKDKRSKDKKSSAAYL